MTLWTVIKVTLFGSSLYSSLSLTSAISSKKSSREIIPSFSSNVFVIDLNSSKFSSLISASSVFSSCKAFFIPVLSRTKSISSVNVTSLAFCNSNITFLNSNSLPSVIEEKILVLYVDDMFSNLAMLFNPIPLLGVLITLNKLISSSGLWISLKYAIKSFISFLE